MLCRVALRKESVDRNPRVDTSSVRLSLSLSARRAWIEIAKSTPEEAKRWSLSARRAWIEISSNLDDILAGVVALRKESVDRNCQVVSTELRMFQVALRKESVDRNTQRRDFKALGLVALRKESVDRNFRAV